MHAWSGDSQGHMTIPFIGWDSPTACFSGEQGGQSCISRYIMQDCRYGYNNKCMCNISDVTRSPSARRRTYPCLTVQIPFASLLVKEALSYLDPPCMQAGRSSSEPLSRVVPSSQGINIPMHERIRLRQALTIDRTLKRLLILPTYTLNNNERILEH